MAVECKKCGSPIVNQYCSDVTCMYNSWPQHVDEKMTYNHTTTQLEKHYNISKRREARHA